MHQFHLSFTEGSIIIKYRSNSKKGVIGKILTELWPFFFTKILAKLSICVFRSITFEGTQQFLSNLLEGYSIINYRSCSNFEVIHKLLTEL